MDKRALIFGYLKILLPEQSKSQRQISRLLYEALLDGKPVNIKELANSAKLPLKTLTGMLEQTSHLEYNNNQQIIAYRGASLKPSKHQMHFDASIIYTWCAFDTLFLLDISNKAVTIYSSCPACDQALSISSVELINTDPAENTMRMSFVKPTQNDYEVNLQNAFCCKVHFFCNKQCADYWLESYPDCLMINLDDAYAVAQERNRLFL